MPLFYVHRFAVGQFCSMSLGTICIIFINNYRFYVEWSHH